MKNGGLIVASIVTIGAMVVTAWIVAGQLPENASLPIHWGIDGTPDGFANKWTALFMPACITAALTLLMAALSRIEPMQANLAKSAGLFRAAWAGQLGLMIVVHLLEVGVALGWGLSVPRVILATIGVLFVGLGNQLGKSRRMYMVGIRTPWTLANEDVWIATHRLGGKAMVLAGIIWLLLAAIGLRSSLMMLVGTLALVAAIIVPMAYSYLLWRRLPESERVS